MSIANGTEYPEHRIAARRGFTLLEITLAVAILGLMSMAIYRFVQSNLISLRVSSEASAADARYGGLRDLLTSQWQSLPAGTKALVGEPLKLDEHRLTVHVLEAVDPAAAILEFAQNNRIDHILIGARQSSLMRTLLGSVSAKVAAEALCTVTVVRPYPTVAEEKPSSADDSGPSSTD